MYGKKLQRPNTYGKYGIPLSKAMIQLTLTFSKVLCQINHKSLGLS